MGVRRSKPRFSDATICWMKSGRCLRHERGRQIAAHVPVVLGCSHACTFCVIPFRRGVERSRPLDAIEAEVRTLAAQGVREVTLLGQIVDRYGKDLPGSPTLADLLRRVHGVDGIDRLRFLTSHPNWMTDELLDAVAALPKACEHFEVPVQAGDDQGAGAHEARLPRRGLPAAGGAHSGAFPGASIATDIIVGFPGETEAQFQRTVDLLADLRLDVAHLARFSPRPGTVAARRMSDDVPDEEKERRFRLLEDLQSRIAAEINRGLLGQTVEVLVEEQHRGRWKGPDAHQPPGVLRSRRKSGAVGASRFGSSGPARGA